MSSFTAIFLLPGYNAYETITQNISVLDAISLFTLLSIKQSMLTVKLTGISFTTNTLILTCII